MGITPAIITAGASLFGAGMSLFGSSNSGSPPPPPPPSYQPQYLGQADSSAMGGIANLPSFNNYAATNGQFGGIAQNLVNNPYASTLQGGANAISPLAMGAGGQQYGAGSSLYGAGSNLLGIGQSYLPYAQQALATGFDPQNALYNQQFQQNTDQTRAAESARGIAMSPYGAGVENQSNLNFNNQWLQNALQRQQTSAGTANTLTGAANSASTTGAGLFNTGAGLQGTGLNTMQLGASLPYSTYNTIGSNALGTLGQYGQFGAAGAGQSQQQIADYLQYLGIGNQSAGVQNQAYANQLTAQNNQFNQGQTLGQNLGKSLSGVAPLFGSGSSTNNGSFTTFNAPGYSFPMAT